MSRVKHKFLASRRLRRLIRLFEEDEDGDLELFRIVAYEELRMLGLAASEIDQCLRGVAGARTIAELVGSLETFAASLATGRLIKNVLISCFRMAARRFGGK